MIRSFLRKQRKIIRGFVHTYVRIRGTPYRDTEWWDDSFYVTGVSDRQTIAPRKSAASALYHYASVEMLILGHLVNNSVSLENAAVLDLGSGAGHWIDFYLELGVNNLTGIDLSRSCVDHLRAKYLTYPCVNIHFGRISNVLDGLDADYDLVNAVGVMFHIVDDHEWNEVLRKVATALRAGGIFVVSGHFGMVGSLNVQIDAKGQINKRVRSKSRWARALTSGGFSKIEFYRNTSYLYIEESLPENNVLVAKK